MIRAALAALALLVALPAAPATLVAAVASDQGLLSDLPLHYAESDARDVLSALSELNPGAESTLILEATPGDLRTLLARFEREVRPEDTVILFLSSHGDGRGAHLSGEVLAWDELERRLAALPGRVVLSFVDACQSGVLVGEKGFLRGPPLPLEVRRPSAAGHVLITSSGATELSHESALLGGSPFAKHLVSGLRGAADRDGDGAITMSELYQHLYERTIASTLSAPLGPQRPRQKIELSGAGSVVIAEVRQASGSVRGDPQRTLPCWVLDRAEARVLGELRGAESLHLPQGGYLVKCARSDEQIDVAPAELRGELLLRDLAFRPRPKSASLVKGATDRPLSLLLGAGALGGPARTLVPSLSLALEGGSGELGWNVQVVLHRDDDQHAGGLLLGGLSYRLSWWRAGHLDVGLEAGLNLDPLGPGAAIGQFVRLELKPSARLAIVARAEALTLTQSGREPPLNLGFLFTLGIALPIEPESGIQVSRKGTSP